MNQLWCSWTTWTTHGPACTPRTLGPFIRPLLAARLATPHATCPSMFVRTHALARNPRRATSSWTSASATRSGARPWLRRCSAACLSSFSTSSAAQSSSGAPASRCTPPPACHPAPRPVPPQHVDREARPRVRLWLRRGHVLHARLLRAAVRPGAGRLQGDGQAGAGDQA